MLALALGGAVVYLLLNRGASGWRVLAFAVMPDLALLAGIAPGLAKGQIHPRAVHHYNALHRFVGPVLLAIAAALWLGVPWLGAALAWGAHIAIDRALGIGLRTREGFIAA